MKRLNLPVIKGHLSEPKVLSMDDYLKFVQLNLEYFFDKEAHAEWKKMLVVSVPFLIK